MATLKTSTLLPDPTFYPSPKVAMQAAPEKLAFVSLPNPSQDGSSDALALVDVDPQSLKDGQIVGEMKAPLPGTNFTTSVGMRVAPGFVLILRIRTWSVVISSYRVCAHRPCCSVPATAGRILLTVDRMAFI
jgi:selenium binding protein SBP56